MNKNTVILLSKVKQSLELRSLTNNSFKTFLITLLSLTLLFSISCSNEGTTGGEVNGGGSISVSEEANNSKDITVVSSSSSVYSAGTVGFSVSGASDYDVSIQSVDSGSNPLTLDASDFSYTKSTKELTLSSSGITKFKSATLTETTAYKYTITFKFADSSDASKETTANVTINLYKAKVITKTEIEDMIKSMKTVRVDDSSYKNVAQFTFSSTTFSANTPNFNASNIGSTEKNIKFSKSSGRIWTGEAIKETSNYKTYFSGLNIYHKEPLVVGANCTFYFRFTLKGGYALSSEVAHITSDGLSIQLKLSSVNSQGWE
ncbi:hypothetical protein [Brachyspira aalborgi]|uniref:Cadherin domain-containing protein n=1 Tax=Brachyspira aalborgi TaxID=29522 RepID=A0AB38Q0Q5_9SPIR|nr:hypothetical protein [Brachyspira aalborgi]TXJ24537.1 hypothetical protein EPJ73_11970 [Brachyspira aalborgi]